MSTTAPPKPLWRRILRQGVTIVFTLFVIGFAIGAVILGQSVLAGRAADVVPPDQTEPMQVATDYLKLETGYTVARQFPGQIQAAQRTTMAFEQGGTVAELSVEEGDKVAFGSLIAQLDTRLIHAEKTRLAATRTALEAQVELARRTTNRQTELRDRGFASNQAVDNIALRLLELEARIAEIDASLVSVDLQLEKSQLRAPFAATISTRLIDTGAAVGAGQPIVSLVEAQGQQFRVGLTPAIAAELSLGDVLQARFGKRKYSVKLASVLPELDSATRTRTLLFDFIDNDLPPLRDTGMLVIDQRVTQTGAWVPLSALQDAPKGLWRIMTISGEAQSVVHTEAVEVLFSDAHRAYVQGTFTEGTRFVTDGPHRVVKGQKVRVLGEAS